jgi:uncharacterized protein (TIGR03663 family)
MSRATVLFLVGLLALTAAALAIRVPRLVQRPMHGDEANQAVKAGLLWETGVYEYDPRDHHGPSLYWLTLPALGLSGTPDLAHSTEFTYRIVPVVFGTALVLLLVLVADGIGGPAAILAGVFVVVSPAMVYYARYYIQETLLVFFTFAAVGCAWRYVRQPSFGWAVATGACCGLMHATKETWVLAAAAMAGGLVLSLARKRWRDGVLPRLSLALVLQSGCAATLAGVVVAVLLYSAFGREWRGLLDSLRAYAGYWERGRAAGEAGIHEHPWYFYLQLLVAYRPARGFFWSEGLIVGLAAVGGVAAVRRWNHPTDASASAFCRFLAFYTLLLTGLYSALPYKTPWCLLSFLQAMTVLAGVGAWTILRGASAWLPRALAAAVLAAGLAHLGWECYQLNFNVRLQADQRNPYVYAHTSTDVLNLAQQLERLAAVSPEGQDLVIHVVTPENYWPLPWYLRQFRRDHIGYWQDPAVWIQDTRQMPPPAVIMLTSAAQDQVDAHLRGSYNQQMMYGLRPGEPVMVYVREDLWRAFVAAAEARAQRSP